MTTSESARLTAATKTARAAGVTLAEYQTRVAAGLKWCRGHDQWHPMAEFGSDPKGESGLTRSCRAARRVGGPGQQRPSTASAPGRARRPSDLPIALPLPDPGPGPRRRVAARTVRAIRWDRAACRDVDPELFFPVSTTGPAAQQVAAAVAVCAGCPVRAGCLRTALARGEEFGIYGGLTAEERAERTRAAS